MRRRTGEARLALRLALALAAALVVAPPAPAHAAEPRIEAQADRTELAEDEVLTLEIRLESSDAPTSLELGETDAFEIVSRAQSRQTSFSLGGGAGVQLAQVVVMRLGLAPRRTGALIVPAAIAVVKGRRYETKPIPVTVLGTGAGAGGGGGPRPPATPPGGSGQSFRGWEKDLVLDVQLDRASVYLGEQVTASIWLFSPLGVVEYEAFTPPRYEGFWAEDLETPRSLQFQVKQLNGVPTRAYLLQRVALFPTRAGTLTLSPAELAVAVRLGSSPFDPFPDVRRLRRKSRPVSLEVKPLPAGAPPGFESVNVGRFKLEAALSEPRVAAGQPVAVRITAAGEGNVRALALPRLPAIPGAKAFDPTSSDKVAPKGGRMGGARTLETVLVPERTGELVIPALEWPTFDPRTARYEIARTQELRVAVGPGAPGEPAAAAGTNALAAGLRPIRADGELARPSPPPWRSPLFAALLVLPPLAVAGLALAGRLRARAGASTARRLRAAARAARRRLAAARRHLTRDNPGFLAEVERALVGYAGDRLGRSAAGLTRDALAGALAGAGAPPRAVRALLAALEQGDAARYGAGDGGEALLAAAERALALLEEADWAEPPSAPSVRAGGEA